MNRRNFLASILALSAAPAIVRAQSLMRISGIIIPDTETVAAIAGGNSLLTIDMITREALRILHTKMQFLNTMNRDFDESFTSANKVLRVWAKQ